LAIGYARSDILEMGQVDFMLFDDAWKFHKEPIDSGVFAQFYIFDIFPIPKKSFDIRKVLCD
ncbi:MAG: hypothetical protein K2N25_08620, partial [Muribaculaceae bacterium]|nr:hypothetical protein [Muribaculaceae bacterium]